MTRRVLAFTNRMCPIWIGHHGKRLVVANQLVDQQLSRLVMAVVVARAMNQKEIAFQLMREVDRRSLHIAFGIVTWKSHVALLINRVVVPHVWHRRD